MLKKLMGESLIPTNYLPKNDDKKNQNRSKYISFAGMDHHKNLFQWNLNISLDSSLPFSVGVIKSREDRLFSYISS